MDHITRTRLLWINNTIESLKDMLEDKEFLSDEVESVVETIEALKRIKNTIK